MTTNTKITLAGVLVLIIAAVAWIVSGDRAGTAVTLADDTLLWFESGPYEVGVETLPGTPKIGENKLNVEIRLPNGDPISDVTASAYAEMPAMGSMSAMRAPAGLVAAGDGRFEGSLDLRMRGAWPLTVSISHPVHGNSVLTFDLATDRPELRIASGGRLLGASTDQAVTAVPDGTITIDNRRRQLIGLETASVTHHDLTRTVRAVGRVSFDERRLTNVTLKYDAWIGELDADYVGAYVRRGQRLFSVYGPELLAAQQEYLEARDRLSRREADSSLLGAARQRLRLWDLSDQEISALEERGTPREYVPIYSTVEGTVVAKHVNSGSGVKTGQTLLRIADLSQVWIEADIYEAELELISEGMPATVSLPYLPGESLEAVVEYIYPYLDKTTRTGRIRLTLDNAAGQLKPDMYAEVSLIAGVGHRLAVPEEAVLFAGDSRVVFVDLGEGRLRPVRIQTGQHADGMIEVTDGLQIGDVIVTSGNFLIAAETKLKAGIDQW